MQSTDPFDPSDWTTITPLFEALIAAPVADGGFMDWLAQWNQLDIAVWDAYTVLKRRAYYDTRDLAAEQVYAAYVQELYSTYLGQTNALINRALALQPTPPTPNFGSAGTISAICSTRRACRSRRRSVNGRRAIATSCATLSRTTQLPTGWSGAAS